MSNKFHITEKCLPQSQPMVLVSSWSPRSFTLTAFAKDIFQLQTYKLIRNLSFLKLIKNYQYFIYASNLDHWQNFWHLPFTRSSIEKPVSWNCTSTILFHGVVENQCSTWTMWEGCHWRRQRSRGPQPQGWGRRIGRTVCPQKSAKRIFKILVAVKNSSVLTTATASEPRTSGTLSVV